MMVAESDSAGAAIAVLHRRALESTRCFVAGIGDSRWTDPTPCDEWDVRSLVNHVVIGNLWAAELASGHTIDEVGDRLDGDLLGASPLAAYDRSTDAAACAFEAPGALQAPCAVSYGPVPGSVYAGHRFIDVLIHGWDIAAATGQAPTLDPNLVQACWDVITPQLADFKASGMFGSSAGRSGATDLQTQLLEALGRYIPTSPKTTS